MAIAKTSGGLLIVTEVIVGADDPRSAVSCDTEMACVPGPYPVSCPVDQLPSGDALSLTASDTPLLTTTRAPGSASPATIGNHRPRCSPTPVSTRSTSGAAGTFDVGGGLDDPGEVGVGVGEWSGGVGLDEGTGLGLDVDGGVTRGGAFTTGSSTESSLGDGRLVSRDGTVVGNGTAGCCSMSSASGRWALPGVVWVVGYEVNDPPHMVVVVLCGRNVVVTATLPHGSEPHIELLETAVQ